MTADELIARVRPFVYVPCTYSLGHGASYVSNTPVDGSGECDCSGLICWALGIVRYTAIPSYKAFNGGWINTDAIVHDATQNLPSASVLFTKILTPTRGCLVVFASGNGHAHGHVGIVSETYKASAAKVIHCSAHNQPGRAIQETGPEVFLANPRTIYVWPKMLTQEVVAAPIA